MNSKKAITLLVLATLTMSLIPITTSFAAIDNVTVDGVAAQVIARYGDTLVIEGDGVTAGKNVKAYWDAVDAWDGEAGLLNSTKAGKNGAFELWVDVPSAVNGLHYLWLEDSLTGETFMIPDPIKVKASIEFTPDAGLESDTITVKGYGFGDEVDIRLFNATDMTLGVKINQTITTSPATPETNELGYWSATFKVPKIADGWAYDDYNISANDEDWITGSELFTIGPAVTLNKEEGPTGTVVRANGRGFDDTLGQIVLVQIWNGAGLVSRCEVLDDDDLDISGKGLFALDLVIPWVPDVDDDYYLKFTDTNGWEGEADFEVTGLPEIDTTPDYAIQGSTVSIKGYNYTGISGVDVDIYVVPEGSADPIGDGTKVKTLETDRDGQFTGTFKLPGLASDTYEIWAIQTDYLLNNTEQVADDNANFKIGLMIVILSPDSGPSGTLVSMTASGFEEGGAGEWNATLGDVVIEDNGGVEVDGSINYEFWVPSMEPGVYTLSVLDIDNDITVTAEFEVTHETYVSTTPLKAPNDFNMTIEGWYFAEDPGVDNDLEFVLYNATDDWDMDVTWGGVATTLEADDDWDDGYFKGYWGVLDEDTLSLGVYTMNVTDGKDLFAQFQIEIVAKTVDIEPRKTTFKIGETVSFDVVSSFIQDDSYIKVWTPDGSLYWKTDAFDEEDWVKIDTVHRYPYFSQIASGNLMTLLEDAPLGEYSWTWYDVDDDELDAGVFTVTQADADVIGEQVADLNNQITDLADQLTSVSSEFDDVKSDIADVAAIAAQAVAAAQQAAEAVTSVAQTANTASQAAADAATAAEAARDAANGLTTLVYGAIGAALVAALAAIVSLMQISKRIAG